MPQSGQEPTGPNFISPRFVVNVVMAPKNCTRQTIFFYAILFEGFLAVLAVGIGWLMGYHPIRNLQATCCNEKILAAEVLWGLLAVFPMLLIPSAVEMLNWEPLQEIKRLLAEFVRWLCAGRSTLELAAISGVAGFSEELLFRGTLLEGILHHFGSSWLILAGSSLLFGLAHAITLTYFVLATGAGIYFGVLVMATESLVPAMVAHSVYDFVVLSYMTRRLQHHQ